MVPFHTKLIDKEEIAENTYRYDFEKKDFVFTAGQYVIIDIDEPLYTDEQPKFRSLSIASAPHEEHLSFIMRHSESAFKKSLHDAEIDLPVTMKGPLGHFILPEDASVPIVYLTAGVGITPVRSMLRHLAHTGETRQIIVCDSNRTVASAPCIAELQKIDLENYSYIGAITDDPDGWSGYSGMIDTEFLYTQVAGLDAPLFYVVGTKGFINGMKGCLAEMVIPAERIIVDNFG